MSVMHRWQGRAMGVSLALVLVLAGSALAPAAPAGKTFRYNFFVDYAGARLDIGKGYTLLGPNLFVGLTRISPENKIVPGAAERWDISRDQLTYTFFLRKDLKWSDGRGVTAHDFEFGWKRALNPATKSIRNWMLYLIEGAEAYYKGAAGPDGVGVKAVDDFTLRVNLVRPAAFFPAYVAANNVYFAQPKHLIDRVGDNWVRPEHLVFSGPFRITRYVPNSLVVMEPNPGWTLKQPNVSRVEYHVVPAPTTILAKYEAGELDFAQGVPIGEVNRIKNDPRLREQFIVMSESRVMTLQFNTRRAPWNNVKVRQAFVHAVDQEELTRGPFRGALKSALSLRPPGMPGADLDYIRRIRSEERARALLAEAGYPGGKDFPEIAIQSRNQEDSIITAEYLQFRLTQVLQIRVKVEVMEANAFLDKVQSGRGDIWISAVFSLSPDLYDLYNVIEGAALTNSQWKHTHFATLLMKAAAEPDPTRRRALYDEAERYLVVQHAVMLPLYVTETLALVSPKVKGLREDKRSIWNHTWEYIDLAE